MLDSFLHPLQSIAFKVVVVAIPGGDAASQDTLDGALIEVAEYPGVHAGPPHPSEEEQPLSCCLDNDASVMGPR